MSVVPEQSSRQEVRQATRTFLESQLGFGRHFTLLGVKNSDVVAIGSLEIFERLPYPENLSGKEGYILNIFVQPEIRRQGVAQRVVQFLVEQARLEEIGRLWLHPSASGKSVYKRAGFKTLNSQEMQLYLNEK